MRTATVAAVVLGYGATMFTLGATVGWLKRRQIDAWQLADADKVIGQAITDRQTAINNTGIAQAELLRVQWAVLFCDDLEAEYRKLIEDEKK